MTDQVSLLDAAIKTLNSGKRGTSRAKAVAQVIGLAESGFAEAQFELSWWYANGCLGLPKDTTLEIKWLRRAAATGHSGATFNLGVLQYLGEARLLSKFDYLSTVSGGGYIGGWLHGWIHRTDEERAKGRDSHRGTRSPIPYPRPG